MKTCVRCKENKELDQFYEKRTSCKSCSKASSSLRYENNKEQINARIKKRYEDNPEILKRDRLQVKEWQAKKRAQKLIDNPEPTHKTCTICKTTDTIDKFKKQRRHCKSCLAKIGKDYKRRNKDIINLRRKQQYKENPEKFKAASLKYQNDNREKRKAKCREYHHNNKEKANARSRNYRKNNREHCNYRDNEYRKQKRKTCPVFHMMCKVRSRMGVALNKRGLKKSRKTLDFLGCTSEFLVKYLESKFVGGISWENRSEWHIDHIIPLASARTEEDIYRLSHYTNLQPLWAVDNHKKGTKIITPQKEDELCQEQTLEKD